MAERAGGTRARFRVLAEGTGVAPILVPGVGVGERTKGFNGGTSRGYSWWQKSRDFEKSSRLEEWEEVAGIKRRENLCPPPLQPGWKYGRGRDGWMDGWMGRGGRRILLKYVKTV